MNFKNNNMKSIKILAVMLLMMYAVCSRAQLLHVRTSSKDSMLSTTISGKITGTDSIFISGGSGMTLSTFSQPNEYKYDTVKIAMFVCDTTLGRNGAMTTVYWRNPLMRAEQEHHSVNWIYGYAVRKITIEKFGNHQSGDFVWFNQSDKYYYNTEKYLDDAMRPLSSDIIVWQVVPAN